MWHLGAYMGHKEASDKQQNRDQEFLEKIQLSEKLRKRPKIHRMVKNIFELWISSYIRSAQRWCFMKYFFLNHQRQWR